MASGSLLLISFLFTLVAEAAPTVQVSEGGRADRPTGTAGPVLIQETKVEVTPCGDPREYEDSLSEVNLPPQTNLMRMIASQDHKLDGSEERTKECMTHRLNCGYWMVNPHEPLDGEENDGNGETLALTGYTRSLPKYVLNFKIFDQKRYHESAETVSGLAARAASDESKAQAALAEHLRSMAENFRKMRSSTAELPYPYNDLPLTISSLEKYAEIAEKREKLLSIVACINKDLAEKDHDLEEKMRRNLTSLYPSDITDTPGSEPPALAMGNEGASGINDKKKNSSPQKSETRDWRDEVTMSFNSYDLSQKESEPSPAFTDDDTLFQRIHYQMRKRELPGDLGPYPMGVGSVDRLRINREFQLERY